MNCCAYAGVAALRHGPGEGVIFLGREVDAYHLADLRDHGAIPPSIYTTARSATSTPTMNPSANISAQVSALIPSTPAATYRSADTSWEPQL